MTPPGASPMIANLLLVLTALPWLALAGIGLRVQQIKGEYLVGAGFIQLALLAVFMLLSLLHTVHLLSAGGFDWVSSERGTRKLVVGAGWCCAMAALAFLVMNRPGRPDTNVLERVLSLGIVWMPLLLLVPYAILSNPTWKSAVAPSVYGVPLAGAALTGVALLVAPALVASSQSRGRAEQIAQAEYDHTVRQIQAESRLAELLKMAENYSDARYRAAALARIQALPALEDSLLALLQQESLADAHWTYVYLSRSDVAHAERFVEPMQRNLAALAANYQARLQEAESVDYTFYYTNVETILQAIDRQLPAQRAALRPSLQALREVLDTPMQNERAAPPTLLETRTRYRQALTRWLERPVDR